MRRKVDELVSDIRRAAYLYGTGKYTLKQVGELVGRDERTIYRWKLTEVWKSQIALMAEEG